MGLVLQVIWQLVNLCAIAVALALPGSSGSFVQSLAASPSIKPPSDSQTIEVPPPFLSPRQFTAASPQHDSANTAKAQPPHIPQVAKPPGTLLLAPETSHEQPDGSNQQPEVPHDSRPPSEPPRDSSLLPAAEPSYDSALTPPAKPPDASPLPVVVKPPNPVAQLPAGEPPWALSLPPSSMPPPFLPSPPPALPPHSSSTQSPAPPDASSPSPQLVQPRASPPNFTLSSHALPPHLEPPPFLSSPSAAVEPPPILHSLSPVAEPPFLSVLPPVIKPSHDSTLPPHAEPPHTSVLPLAAKPPDAVAPLPVAEPPRALTLPTSPEAQPFSPFPPPGVPQHASALHSPPVPSNPSSLPPQLVQPPASPATFIAPSHAPLEEPPFKASPDHTAEPPLASIYPPVAEPLHNLTRLPAAKPPHASAVPLAAKPPVAIAPLSAVEPPPALPQPPPPEAQTFLPSPPPRKPRESPPILLNPSSLPPQLIPLPASPATFIAPSNAPLEEPPFKASPNHTVEPPLASIHPPVAEPLHNLTRLPAAKPPHASALPLAAKPPVTVAPLSAVEPPPALPQPPPPEAQTFLPSPPTGKPLESPPVLSNSSSLPPQLIPLPASSPTFIAPSHAEVPPPLILPLPQERRPFLPSPAPAIPPHAQLVPPDASPTTISVSPSGLPHGFSVPPPTEFPHTTRPPSALVPRGIPSPASTPPPMSAPLLAPPPLVIPSHGSAPPLGKVPPYALSAPPPSELSNSSASPSPEKQATVHAVPPHGSRIKERQTGAAPPMLASPETSPFPRTPPEGAPSIHPIMPGSSPSISHQADAPKSSTPFLGSNASEPHASPLSAPAPSNNPMSGGVPIVAPPDGASGQLSPVNPSPNHAPSEPKFERQIGAAPAPFSFRVHPTSNGSNHSPSHSPVKGFSPFMAPSIHKSTRPSKSAPIPSVSAPKSPPTEGYRSPASSPSSPNHEHLYPRDKVRSPRPSPVLVPPPAPSHQGRAETPYAAYAPKPLTVGRQKSYPPLPINQGSPITVALAPSHSGIPEISPAPSPIPRAPSGRSEIPFVSPKISPSGSSTRNSKRPLAPPIRALPPPPPNEDCAYLTCPEPLTNTPPGSPCSCVFPMQVGLRLSVDLYTFFPLVSELAREIASGVFMKQSQVRVMGANAASQQPEKTIVLVDLVPLDEKFDNITAFLTFQRFWHKQVAIDKSIFGDYDVLYVRYPGLPPSPPMAPADIAVINGMPYSVGDPNGSKMHPLGVDVTKQRHKHRLNGSLIAVIVFSAIVGVFIICSLAWILVARHRNRNSQSAQTPHALPSLARSSGPTGHSTRSGPSSSLSFGSSLATYTGSAKTFNASEMEKATDNFNPSRVLGEGGFGRVYSGVLEDETSVAVKVLKRDDQQGGREFLAEVEMLSRLHHRNLVKLIGICIDEHLRCLVYELVPNGSVESHLHGTDKETAPLDWASRMKIALGAARGLAYLHEDSSPRVIHRDFKSSNILLENDFTPKVSDFGLARTAMDEENRHISTRVMGTFGYVAPEYAMTGHLLVKSDVYSYGVVLLELLTGRKPVDMSQPAGQENLVAWTRPLLTSNEGLESIIDPSLGSDVSFDNVAKVAAIASMCVQPEVSHRPFMGEVVQALKLVCNESDDSKDGDSRSCSRENLSMDFDAKVSPVSGNPPDPLQSQFSLHDHLPRHDIEKALSVSDIFSSPARVGREAPGSFQRHSASGPMRTVRSHQFWQRIRRLSQGSRSEHGMMYRLWAGSH